jgi:hypothetical protein
MEACDRVMMRVAQTDFIDAIRWVWSRAWPARPFSDQTNSLNADRALNSISPGARAWWCRSAGAASSHHPVRHNRHKCAPPNIHHIQGHIHHHKRPSWSRLAASSTSWPLSCSSVNRETHAVVGLGKARGSCTCWVWEGVGGRILECVMRVLHTHRTNAGARWDVVLADLTNFLFTWRHS